MAQEAAKPAAKPAAKAGAKPAAKAPKDKKTVKLDSNRFGTKAGMVVKEIKEGDKVVGIIAHDALGHYMTIPEFVDSGLADPNRYSGSRNVSKELLEKEDSHKDTSAPEHQTPEKK